MALNEFIKPQAIGLGWSEAVVATTASLDSAVVANNKMCARRVMLDLTVNFPVAGGAPAAEGLIKVFVIYDCPGAGTGFEDGSAAVADPPVAAVTTKKLHEAMYAVKAATGNQRVTLSIEIEPFAFRLLLDNGTNKDAKITGTLYVYA
jgi:hypothetical protein